MIVLKKCQGAIDHKYRIKHLLTYTDKTVATCQCQYGDKKFDAVTKCVERA